MLLDANDCSSSTPNTVTGVGASKPSVRPMRDPVTTTCSTIPLCVVWAYPTCGPTNDAAATNKATVLIVDGALDSPGSLCGVFGKFRSNSLLKGILLSPTY